MFKIYIIDYIILFISPNIERMLNSVIIWTFIDSHNCATHQFSQYWFTTFANGNHMRMIWFVGTFIFSNTFVGHKTDAKHFNATVMSNNRLQEYGFDYKMEKFSSQ